MHRPHWMQPSCGPLRMSTPVGQTLTHWWQSMQSPAGSPARGRAAASFSDMRGSPRSQAIGDVERSVSVSAAWMRGHGHM